MYYHPRRGWVVKEKNINRKEVLRVYIQFKVPHCLPTSLKHCSSDINQMKAVLHLNSNPVYHPSRVCFQNKALF